MVASQIKERAVALIASVCIVATLASSPATAGQPPTAGKKGAGSETPAGRKSETDKDKLQGKWQIVSIAFEDKVIKREDKSSAWKGTFDKDLFVEGDRFGQVGYSNAKLKLDPTRDPKQITVQDDAGKLTFRGIYALDGDTLRVCMNGDGSDVRRPEEFVTKKGTPLVLVVLKKRPTNK